MRRYKSSYTICIVTNSLIFGSKELRVFSYSQDITGWTTASDEVLKFEEIVAARVSL